MKADFDISPEYARREREYREQRERELRKVCEIQGRISDAITDDVDAAEVTVTNRLLRDAYHAIDYFTRQNEATPDEQ